MPLTRKATKKFISIQVASTIAIFIGLYLTEELGNEFAKIIFFAGVIVGCLNVLIGGIIGLFTSPRDD